MKSPVRRMEVPFYDWKPYIHPISNTFSIVLDHSPHSVYYILETRKEWKDPSSCSLFTWTSISYKSIWKRFVCLTTCSKHQKSKMKQRNRNTERETEKCTPNIVLKSRSEPSLEDKPGSRHRSNYQISWHRSAHQMENIPRLSHRRIYKSQVVSIRLVHCTIAWP